MQCIRVPSILVLAAMLVLSSPVSSQLDRETDTQNQDNDLEMQLHNHRLLQRARSAGLLSQEWSKRAVEDLLAQMTLSSQRDAEAISMATGGRATQERSIDSPNSLPPRERKAGCKNFYWKGFTSC